MSTMRAVLIKDGKGPSSNLYIGEAPKPVPKEGQVIVKIKAFGLNRMDISQRNGGYPIPPGASEILGVEFSGHIVELGPSVSGWSVGDEVLGLAGGGAYAEYIAVFSTHILRKPSHLSHVEAASIMENYLTAYQAVVLVTEIRKDDHALIHAGASGVGLAAAQLARFYSSGKVISTTSSQEKIDCILSLPGGPTHGVNYKTQDFSEEVKKITDGKGVGIVVDFIGQSHWAKNLESMALDGRMVLLSALSGLEIPKVNLGPILFKRLRIQGSTLRSRSIAYQTDLIQRFGRELLDKITGEKGDGALRLKIHAVYPWADIIKAHNEMEANNNSGKIICEIV